MTALLALQSGLQSMSKAEEELPSEGMESFGIGIYLLVNASPQLASESFEKAETVFQSAGEEALAGLSEAMKLNSRSLVKLQRLNYADAIQDLHRAKVRLEAVIEEVPREIKQLFEINIMEIEYNLPYYEGLSRLTSRDFDTASQKLEEASNSIAKSVKHLGALGAPAELTTLYEGLRLFSSGQSKLAKAEHLSSIGKHKEAEAVCETASSDISEAAQAFLKSKNLPQASALNEQCMMLTIRFIPDYRSHYKAKRMLQEENNNLRRELDERWRMITEAAKVTPTLNATQVTQQIQQNTQIVQNIENNVKSGLQDLLAQLTKLSGESREVKELEEEGRGILDERGQDLFRKSHGFLTRLKKFAEKVGQKASPWIPVIDRLLGFLQIIP